MTLREILDEKGHSVVTARPDHSLADVCALLREHRIGAAVVSADGKQVDGIISERDIVDALAQHGADALAQPASAYMTRDVHTGTPDETIDDVMSVMTRKRVRHYPILENGKLAGIISIGDAVKQRLDDLEFETSNLRSYIAGH